MGVLGKLGRPWGGTSWCPQGTDRQHLSHLKESAPGRPVAASEPPGVCQGEGGTMKPLLLRTGAFFSALWDAGVDVELFI